MSQDIGNAFNQANNPLNNAKQTMDNASKPVNDGMNTANQGLNQITSGVSNTVSNAASVVESTPAAQAVSGSANLVDNAASKGVSEVGSVLRPYSPNRFWVEIDYDVTAFFTECSGLKASMETFTYWEGGKNLGQHVLPGRTSYTNITLKRGFGQGQKLWNWFFHHTAIGKPDPKNITIFMYSAQVPDLPVATWFVYDAWPIRWSGPDLNASNGSSYAIEEVELTFDRFESLYDKIPGGQLLGKVM